MADDVWGQLESGVGGPAAVIGIVTEALETEKFEALYDVLRARTWHIVRAGIMEDEDRQWGRAIQRVGAVCRARKGPDPRARELATRLEALSDLISDTIAFQNTHALNDVLRRAHVLALLRLVRGNGDRISRAQLLTASKLKNPNLNRVLDIIEANALIERTAGHGQSSREVMLTLTALGQKVMKALEAEGKTAAPEVVAAPPATRSRQIAPEASQVPNVGSGHVRRSRKAFQARGIAYLNPNSADEAHAAA